jgi:hypothetical protein
MYSTIPWILYNSKLSFLFYACFVAVSNTSLLQLALTVPWSGHPVILFFRCSNTGIDKKYRFLILSFSRLSHDTVVKVILLLMKLLSSSENDDHNSSLRDKYWTRHQCSANSSQNRKLPHSNELQSFKRKLESAINERLLTVPTKKSSSLGNMAKN